jgi:hypothetical protein
MKYALLVIIVFAFTYFAYDQFREPAIEDDARQTVTVLGMYRVGPRTMVRTSGRDFELAAAIIYDAGRVVGTVRPSDGSLLRVGESYDVVRYGDSVVSWKKATADPNPSAPDENATAQDPKSTPLGVSCVP